VARDQAEYDAASGQLVRRLHSGGTTTLSIRGTKTEWTVVITACQ
jgi:hypothetical protein